MEDFDERTPVEKRTPITEAWGVVCGLCEVWEVWGVGEKLNFMDSLYGLMWSDENTNGEDEIGQIGKTEELTEWEGKPLLPALKASLVQIAVMRTSCAFAIQAMKAKKNSRAAWAYACEANLWLGYLRGIAIGKSMEQNSSKLAMSVLGKMGADAAHAENRALKKVVFEWCDSNMASFKSMDGASTAVAGKVVPVTFRTARAWIADWKKTRRSTGTLQC